MHTKGKRMSSIGRPIKCIVSIRKEIRLLLALAGLIERPMREKKTAIFFSANLLVLRIGFFHLETSFLQAVQNCVHSVKMGLVVVRLSSRKTLDFLRCDGKRASVLLSLIAITIAPGHVECIKGLLWFCVCRHTVSPKLDYVNFAKDYFAVSCYNDHSNNNNTFDACTVWTFYKNNTEFYSNMNNSASLSKM